MKKVKEKDYSESRVEPDMNNFKSLKLNEYGNFDASNGVPKGFVITNLTVSQLKKLKIDSIKAFTGFKRSGKNFSPILVNLILKSDEKKAKVYLAKKSKLPAKNTILEKVFKKLKNIGIDYDKMEIEKNKESNGKLFKLLTAWAKGQEDFEKEDLIKMINMISTAHRRHNETDYDSIDKRGLNKDQVDAIRKTYNKKG